MAEMTNKALANVITGTPSDDSLSGTNIDDIIYGLGGNDFIGLASEKAVKKVMTPLTEAVE